MDAGDTRFWFPAKRYGWGWGPPSAWQGWVVYAAYVACLVGGALWLDLRHQAALYGLLVLFATVALIGVCWLKGERPRWRWGRD